MTNVAVLVSNDINQDQRMHRICTELAEMYESVTLVGRLKSNSKPMDSRTYRCERMKLKSEKGVLFYFNLFCRHFLWLKANKPKLVYAVDVDTLLAASMYKKIFGCTLVYDAHEYFTEVPELSGEKIKKAIWKLIERMGVSFSDIRITVNKSLAEIFDGQYDKRYHVVRNVPKLSETVSKKDTSKYIIIYQGVLNQGRGLETLISFVKKNTKYTLWIVGEGDLSIELRNLSEGCEQIVFWGWVYGQELRDLTSQAWVGMNLLEPKSLNYTYSLANKFFDYMHAAVPSVNMNFPEYKRINDELSVSVLIDTLSIDSIEHAIMKMEDKGFYDTLVKNAQGLKEIYNWNHERLKLRKILPQLT